jgi:hypothetical protein
VEIARTRLKHSPVLVRFPGLPSLDKARETALKSVRELVAENIWSYSDTPVLPPPTR